MQLTFNSVVFSLLDKCLPLWKFSVSCQELSRALFHEFTHQHQLQITQEKIKDVQCCCHGKREVTVNALLTELDEEGVGGPQGVLPLTCICKRTHRRTLKKGSQGLNVSVSCSAPPLHIHGHPYSLTEQIRRRQKGRVSSRTPGTFAFPIDMAVRGYMCTTSTSRQISWIPGSSVNLRFSMRFLTSPEVSVLLMYQEVQTYKDNLEQKTHLVVQMLVQILAVSCFAVSTVCLQVSWFNSGSSGQKWYLPAFAKSLPYTSLNFS